MSNCSFVGHFRENEPFTGSLRSRIIINDYVISLYQDGENRRIRVSRSGEDDQILDWTNGVGIKSVTVNDDSSITFALTDGTSTTTPPLKGQDAEVTLKAITDALGYTPASEGELKALAESAVKSVNNTLPDNNGNVTIDADISQTVHYDALTGELVGKYYLMPDGSIYRTGSESFRLFKYDVSALADGQHGVDVLTKKDSNGTLAWLSFTNVPYEQINKDNVTAETIVTPPRRHIPGEMEIHELPMIPIGANTLLVCVGTAYIAEYPKVIGKAYGVFVEDVGALKSALGDLQTEVEGKQEALVSGQNIKTINGESVLGAGNIVVQGGGAEKEWVLVGVITTDAKAQSLPVDLSVYSELAIVSDVTATGNGNLYVNGTNPLINQLYVNGTRKALTMYKDEAFGIVCYSSKYGNTDWAVSLLNGASVLNKHFGDIKSLKFSHPDLISTCELHIYAR